MILKSGTDLRRFLKVNDISPDDLAEAMGVARGTIFNWQKAVSLDADQRERIKEAVKKLNKSSNTDLIVNEPPTDYKIKQIPFFDVEVSSSQITMFDDKPEVVNHYMSIPGFEDCDFAVPNFGDSMYPTYKNGEIMALKKIHDLDVIVYGECYLIITQDYRMVKRILKSKEKDAILAVSDNDEPRKNGDRKYDSFDIPKNKIRKLYLVKGSVRRSQL